MNFNAWPTRHVKDSHVWPSIVIYNMHFIYIYYIYIYMYYCIYRYDELKWFICIEIAFTYIDHSRFLVNNWLMSADLHHSTPHRQASSCPSLSAIDKDSWHPHDGIYNIYTTLWFREVDIGERQWREVMNTRATHRDVHVDIGKSDYSDSVAASCSFCT